MVTSTMTATTRDGDRGVLESKISRSGESVAIEMSNEHGDTVRASLNDKGGITVIVNYDGQPPEMIRVPDRWKAVR